MTLPFRPPFRLPLCLLALTVAIGTAGAAPSTTGAATKARGVPTAIEDAGHVGLRRYYEALREVVAGRRVARALHYGDSTLAADGISRTVRTRLTTRFGDAGPGFVSGANDPRWNRRTDVETTRRGEWLYRTILHGGGGGRYGLGGIVAIAPGGATMAARAVDAAKANRLQKRLEVWYQAGAGYGSVWARADDREVLRAPATAATTEDRRFTLDVPAGFTTLTVGATGGPVPVYGVVMERGAPGVTWESLGIIGVSSKSFTTFAGDNLSTQMATRAPDLVVVMLGGNEASYPVLTANKGAGYVPIYAAALATIRAGAPQASCLVVTPLDQGYFEQPEAAPPPADGAEGATAGTPAPTDAAVAAEVPKGPPRARPGMANLVAGQRAAAKAAGCGFWSAYDAMGGAGSALAWSNTSLGSGDLVHLSPRGLEVVGNHLADAILADYDAWAAGR
ncbi:MAG: GDSL-type esterase/lipase family protein [Pseudomonadota bacterium]|nr:GDSL-type esterase/lipase family protein [Pseudomonadota bacterium]